MIKYQVKNIEEQIQLLENVEIKLSLLLVYDKIRDSKFFEEWFKSMFLNEVEEHKVIVMDNASFNRKNRLYGLCKNANKNLKLVFLPPYSPELNPIEKLWATFKEEIEKNR